MDSRSLLASALILSAAVGCGPANPTPPTTATAATQPPWFRDVAARAGITFKHHDPATPDHIIVETMGSGLAWIDYDADGWPDLFCVQDGPLPPATMPDRPTHKLYRNNRDGTFADVTAEVGLAAAAYGVGVAVGDYDNDGFDDLLVTQLGGLTLFRNVSGSNGGRRFHDVTAEAGLLGTNPHFATSAAWADLDSDGLLDLYVCNYVEHDPANPIVCRDKKTGLTNSCSPSAYPTVLHRVYRNAGGGKFQDVTQDSGLASAPTAPGLGVVAADFDGDGKIDLYVANDLHPAYLWRNESQPGRIRLADRAGPSGCSRTGTGLLIAGMGVDAADVDGSGRPSLFITNFQDQPNILFLNRGSLLFEDASMRAGLGGPSLNELGFGTAFFDADRDGRADLAVANGHVHRTSKELTGVPYQQPVTLFFSTGAVKFREIVSEAGPDIAVPRAGRGLTRCDYDNDGRPDFAVSAIGGPVGLFRNEIDSGNGWVALELIGDGVKSNRNAVGAAVAVAAGGRTQRFWITGGGSYLSANDRRLNVGLGSDASPVSVSVTWPSGRKQTFDGLEPRKSWRLREGQPAPEHVSLLPPA